MSRKKRRRPSADPANLIVPARAHALVAAMRTTMHKEVAKEGLEDGDITVEAAALNKRLTHIRIHARPTEGTDGKDVLLLWPMEKVGQRWRTLDMELVVDGKAYEADEDGNNAFDEFMRLLRAGTSQVAEGGTAPVAGTASAKCDRGVEVRRHSVVRI